MDVKVVIVVLVSVVDVCGGFVAMRDAGYDVSRFD